MMEVYNADRMLLTLLREICNERRIPIASHSGDWILRIGPEDRASYVFGYDFGLNSATAQMVGNDKAATSELLVYAGIPAVEHRLFLGPQMASYVPSSGNWSLMIQFLRENGEDIVCKPNEGTGGKSVYRARSVVELEDAVHRTFSRTRSLCLSPFLQISAEYRVYILRGECYIIYSKERPAVIGDGCSTLLELILANDLLRPVLPGLTSGETFRDLDLLRVPKQDESVLLNWRHNLGQGGSPRLVAETDDKFEQLSGLAIDATQALRIDLAAVDIVEVHGKLMVLEVNCGIMMESFARSSPRNREMAKHFYDRIIEALTLAGP